MSRIKWVAVPLVAAGLATTFAACGDSSSTSSTAAPATESTATAVANPEVDTTDKVDSVKWSYSGAEGPENWGSLSPEFATCDATSQTPINIVDPASATSPEPTINYAKGAVEQFNNGHSVEATAAEGNSITVDGTTSALLQMHFHAKSEHTINGKYSPVEVHFVHKSDDGALTVIGVMLEEGSSANAAWGPFVKAIGTPEGTTANATFDWPAMLPTSLKSVRYSGSLTTPPCTEGVNWLVMTEPVTLSKAQIAAITAVYSDNYRPVQPLNGREVVVTPDGK